MFLFLCSEIDFMISLDTNETRARVEILRSEETGGGASDDSLPAGGAREGLTVENFIIFPNMTHCYNVEFTVPASILNSGFLFYIQLGLCNEIS